MEIMREVDLEGAPQSLVINNEPGSNAVINVNSTVTHNNYSCPEWLNEESFRFVVERLSGK